jgi:hypothetical protein
MGMSTWSLGGRAATVVVASALIVGAGGASPAAAAPPKTQGAALRSLVTQTKLLPRAVTTRSQRRNLLRFATHAGEVARTRPCVAVNDLARYRRILRFVRVKPLRSRRTANRRLASLGPASLTASRLLLVSKRTKACGGGTRPSTARSVRTTVTSSDENGMTVRVQLPALRFVPESAGGQSWTRLALPNTDVPGTPGKPGIPVVSDTFAVPDGATVEVNASSASSYTLGGVDVFPVQPDVADQSPAAGLMPMPDFTKGPFAAKPFTVDKSAYADDGFVPAKPADGKVLGQSRDLVIGNLAIPAAQYDAADRKLKVLNAVDVKVTFAGGPKTFSPELNSPWEQAQRRTVASLLNQNVAKTKLVFSPRVCGEEMLVITNPATRAAADTFAVARRAAGLRTTVVETGAAAGQIGTTATAIQTFIRGHLTAVNCIHPSYVTIMGDDDLVPTFPGINGIPSDLQYSMKTDADELPDVAVGRIIGNDQAAVGTAVAKIIGYETTAPTGNGMLSKATIAAQFQDTDAPGEVNDGQEDRTFVQFAETLRTGLVGRGVAVDRIYEDSPDTSPLRFNDGTDLPASLKKPAFAWDGDGADVSAAWNEGRFMVVHRDHGWSDGWGDPFFTTTEVDALTNGSLLPVVLSINCASGAYDSDETSFAGQALVKPDGGAVGVFGDTRNSPSWHNSQIALGFADALLPTVLPGEGPASKQRTGEALIHGKLRLAGLAPPSGPGIAGGDGSTRNELYLWHYFGDPSMQMWGGGKLPIVFDRALFNAVYKEQPPTPVPGPKFEVNVTLPKELAGQPISLLHNGQVIGKAFAGDGVVTIPASFGDGSVKPGELEVAVEGDGAQPVKVPVHGVPAPKPPPPPPAPPADLIVSDLSSSVLVIKNQGDGAAGAFKATIVDSQSNTITLSFGPLAAGETASQPFDCTQLLRSVTGTADSDGQVAESDETNNALNRTISCSQVQ